MRRSQFTTGLEICQSLVLPTVTHMQFLILDILHCADSEVFSLQLQSELAALGLEHRGPKFYQLMKRLEQSGAVRVQQREIEIAGSGIQRTAYALTNKGRAAWQVTCEFYAARFDDKNRKQIRR